MNYKVRKILACNFSLSRLLLLTVPYNTRYITPNYQESGGIYCNWTRPCGSYIHIIPNTNLPNINLSTTLSTSWSVLQVAAFLHISLSKFYMRPVSLHVSYIPIPSKLN